MKALTFAMRSFGRELRSGEVVVLLSAATSVMVDFSSMVCTYTE